MGTSVKQLQLWTAVAAFMRHVGSVRKNNMTGTKKVIIIEERDFKIQWRALRRIQCYLLVMGTKNDKNHKKEKAQLDQCIKLKKKDISTKHLDINYKRIPPKPNCPKDPMCPCSKFYTNSYYKVGPKSRCVKNLVKKYTCPACKGKKKR